MIIDKPFDDGLDRYKKQRRFAHEYVIDRNGKQAAIRAGYGVKTAEGQGSRLLRYAKVSALIEKLDKENLAVLSIDAQSVLTEMGKLAFANMGDYITIGPDGDPYVDLADLTRDQAAAVTEITVEDFRDGRGEESRDVRKVKVKLGDKKTSLDQLGKYFKLWTDKTEHSVDEGLAGLLSRLDGGTKDLVPGESEE